jgi:membrane associated rhomboid family serine protease
MVLPLGDDNSDRRSIPVVNYALIALNIFVFVVLQRVGTDDSFTFRYAVVPERILAGHNVPVSLPVSDPARGRAVDVVPVEDTPISVYLTLLTSMFLHGGIMHLAGNMLFLWIFGDNVEDVFGKVGYLVFYLLCGVMASLAHVLVTDLFSDPDSRAMMIPTIGASGAISGVLGAYLVRFPTKRVTVILFRILTQVPAYVAIGIWLVLQLIMGMGVFGRSNEGGGVAYAAHVGGFVAGVVIMYLFGLMQPHRHDDVYRGWEQPGGRDDE